MTSTDKVTSTDDPAAATNPGSDQSAVGDASPDGTVGPTPDNPGGGDSALSYGQALEELESLLAELEDADVDVDRLAQRVARGVELVRFCRRRLARVTADVDQVVADLVGDGADGEADLEDPDDERMSAGDGGGHG